MIYLLVFILQIVILYFLSRKVVNKVYGLFYRITKNKKWATYLFAILFLPGTFLHEAAHFLAALFLLVPVGQIELMPQEEGGHLKMGSVPIGKTDSLRRLIIGSAPLLLGISIIFASLGLAQSKNLTTNPGIILFLSWLTFEVGNTMFSSKKDLEGAWVFFVVLALTLLLLRFLGISISINVESEIIKKASIFLLVPIVIDSLILFLFRIAVIYLPSHGQD